MYSMQRSVVFLNDFFSRQRLVLREMGMEEERKRSIS